MVAITRESKLRRAYQAACKDKRPDRFWNDIRKATRERQIKLEDFSVRRLFEEMVPNGRELVEAMKPGEENLVTLTEADGQGQAVGTSSFTTLTSQLAFSTMLENFENPQFLGDKLMETVPSSYQWEKWPGAAPLGDDADDIGEAQPYPYAKTSENVVETPRTVKSGEIVAMTKEILFHDQTGLVVQRCRAVGQALGFKKEKRQIDCATGITNTFKRNGTSMNTYLTSGLYINTQSSNALQNYTDIENALLYFENLTDPDTGEPVSIMATQILVPGALLMTAKNVLNSTEIRIGDGASASVQQIGGNPLAGHNFEILTNPWVKARTGSTTSWFIGDFKRAFVWLENWPLTVVPDNGNSEVNFTHDIVARWKASFKGVPVVRSPWHVQKCTP